MFSLWERVKRSFRRGFKEERAALPTRYTKAPGIIFRHNGTDFKILAGPYQDMFKTYGRAFKGVKLAPEIKLEFSVECRISDFSVPDVKEARAAIIEAFLLLQAHRIIFTGCLGGLGRTGLFLALMVKVFQYKGFLTPEGFVGDPVDFVRGHYSIHAVETKEQEKFVRLFDADSVAVLLQDAGVFGSG